MAVGTGGGEWDMVLGTGDREGHDPGLWREGGIWPKALGRGRHLTVGTGGQRAKLPVGLGRGKATAVGTKGREMSIVRRNSELLGFVDYPNLFSHHGQCQNDGFTL